MRNVSTSVRPYVCPYVRPQNPSHFGHFGPILGVLGLIWAYFGGSGPDLGHFGPILRVLYLILAILALFNGFRAWNWTILGLFWRFWA